ncbi:MAG: hypothetical protein M0Z95_05695 [Actinomycetota bacterium]|nr:hypothetical protein [Actinomycetota bacterium]
MTLAASIALVVIGVFTLVVSKPGIPPSGGVATEGNLALVSYHGPRDQEGGGDHETTHFTISGTATKVLYPGTTSPIDLTFSDKTGGPITLPATSIIVTVTSPSSSCPASRNFRVQTLRAVFAIPAHSVGLTLASSGITPARWPRIKMLTTGVTQDACQGLTLTLHFSYSPRGGDNDD